MPTTRTSHILPRDVAYPYPIGIEPSGVVTDVRGRVTRYGTRLAFVSAMQRKVGTCLFDASLEALRKALTPGQSGGPVGLSDGGGARPLAGILLRVITPILVARALDDVKRLVYRPPVLVGGGLDILVRDVCLAHLEVRVHAATGQTHSERS